MHARWRLGDSPTAYAASFASVPGLDPPNGFIMAMALMASTCLGLYVVFKRRDRR